MNGKELAEAIGAKYGVKANTSYSQLINRAIRTLPGGAELLDAIETTNAARNHADRVKAHDKVVALDAAIENLESIRSAMENHIIESVS